MKTKLTQWQQKVEQMQGFIFSESPELLGN